MANPGYDRIDTLAKFKACWLHGPFDHRFTLDDYSRVIVQKAEATVLEAAPSVIDARCTACPLMHSRSWDCTRPGITLQKSKLPGFRLGYCPVLGIASRHLSFVDESTPTPHRRLYTTTVKVRPL